MASSQLLFIFTILVLLSPVLSFNSRLQRFNHRRSSIVTNARVAKAEEGTEDSVVDKDDPKITIPFKGIVGESSPFDKPLDEYDPLKNTDDLPGEDGSEQKINAIQKRIQDRVDQLKKQGEWEVETFGKDPLASISIFQTMAMQLKVCKPYESASDLLLTYTLVLITTISLMAYLIFLRETLDAFMPWFLKTDFDFQSILNR